MAVTLQPRGCVGLGWSLYFLCCLLVSPPFDLVSHCNCRLCGGSQLCHSPTLCAQRPQFQPQASGVSNCLWEPNASPCFAILPACWWWMDSCCFLCSNPSPPRRRDHTTQQLDMACHPTKFNTVCITLQMVYRVCVSLTQVQCIPMLYCVSHSHAYHMCHMCSSHRPEHAVHCRIQCSTES